LRFIYTYEADAADINVMSGYPCSILAQLERRGHDVVRIFPLRRWSYCRFALKYYRYQWRNQIYRPDREPAYLRSLARQIEKRARGVRADLLLAPGSHVISALQTPHPKAFIADATFANMLDFYDGFERCAPEFVRQGHEMERNALERSVAVFYPTEWAARSAIEHYGASPDKVHVIPWGANVEPPSKDVVQASIRERSCAEPRILFIGREWLRKGTDTVLATCELLRRRGMPLRLDIVGLTKVPVDPPAWVHLHGLLDKNDPVQNETFRTLLMRSHVLFVPSRAENYGMVFCEAASFGVPSLATAVGGITTIVRSGESGFTLPAGSSPEAFADVLEDMVATPALYMRLALASLEDYHARLNWDVFATRMLEICENLS
jgi:glycosyltransferase involved in cell wall biosynthesis